MKEIQNIKTKLLILTTVLAGFSITAIFHPTFAAVDCSGTIAPTIDCGFSIIGAVIYAFIGISAVVFFFMLLISGYSFITAGGDSKKVESARKSLFYSVIGFGLIFMPFIIFQIIGRVTSVSTGLLVSNNGNLTFNPESTFTETPLPSYYINKTTSTPTSTSGGSTLLGPGCNVGLALDETPIFYQQWGPTNPPDYANPFWYNTPCEHYGEYQTNGQLDYNKYNNDGYSACNPSSLITVVDTYLNRLDGGGNLIISDGIDALNKFGGFDSSSGYQWSPDVAPYYRFGHDLQAANYLMQTKAGNQIHFKAYAIQGSGSAPYGTSADFDRVAKAANAGYPVIVGMTNHYMTILNVDYSSPNITVTAADTGHITAYGWGTRCFKSRCYFRFNPDGTQSVSKQVFMNNWTGAALLLVPDNINVSL